MVYNLCSGRVALTIFYNDLLLLLAAFYYISLLSGSFDQYLLLFAVLYIFFHIAPFRYLGADFLTTAGDSMIGASRWGYTS